MTEALERLKPFATIPQRNLIDAVILHGGVRAAERSLGKGNDSIGMMIRRLTVRAAAKGYSPDHDMTHATPDPFLVKGISTHYVTDKETGEEKISSQWVKTRIDGEGYKAAVEAAVEAMCEDIPRLDPIAPPAAFSPALLNLYTLTDCHVGMLAWRKEGGEDWDLKIAEKTLVGCFEHMILTAPAAGTAVINQLGDFLHSDGLLPVTPTSGHILDQDGRFSKMVAVAIRVLRRICDIALMKHEKVIVIMAEGNHDLASSVWLRHMFKALYENEPRLSVVDSELPYYALEHGQTMLAFHHGHLKKPDMLTPVIAAQYAPIWGRTKYRYAHMGHQHHFYEKEHNGMTVTQHPTLCARDAYAARGGWFAARAANAITYHDVYGQVARTTVVPEMLEA